jgi:hypothetical protein
MRVKIPLLVKELEEEVILEELKEGGVIPLETLEKVEKIKKLLENPPYIEINLTSMLDELPSELQKALKKSLENYLKSIGRILMLSIALELVALDTGFEMSLMDVVNRGLEKTIEAIEDIKKQLTNELIRRQGTYTSSEF